MGYSDGSRVWCIWSASSLWRLGGASETKIGVAKSLCIQDQVRWSRQCPAIQGHASLPRKSPKWRSWHPGYLSTDSLLGPGWDDTRNCHQLRSWDAYNRRMNGFFGSWLGGRDLYVPATGIFLIAPNLEPMQTSKINDFPEDGPPVETVSFWREEVFACLVQHI